MNGKIKNRPEEFSNKEEEIIEITKKEALGYLSIKNAKQTAELKAEGVKRELVRSINALRKNAGLTIKDRVNIYWQGSEAIKAVIDKYRADLAKDNLADEIRADMASGAGVEKEINVGGEKVIIRIEKI